MTINEETFVVSGISVSLSRKPIKNVHLSVHPPKGVVRLSVPTRMKTDIARLAVIRRLKWVQQKQREFQEQARESERCFVSGESHYFDGHRYLLDVVESGEPPCLEVLGNGKMRLSVEPNSSQSDKARLFDQFYRSHIRGLVAQWLPQWEGKRGVSCAQIRIQRMKTRWGSCNPDTGRILLNLELAKKPKKCVEFILVHELVHLLERHHNDRFIALMDDALPDWRQRKETLKSYPLAYETWEY